MALALNNNSKEEKMTKKKRLGEYSTFILIFNHS